MGSLDGHYFPFTTYPAYRQMAPCMRSCNDDYSYNGCDNAACWCKKGNLDLRVGSISRCASTSCTFANMNTATDLSILSGVQVQYCVDSNHSPAGMALPSAAQATPTESEAQTTGGATETSGSGTESRTGVTGGPSATDIFSDFSSPTSTSSPFSPSPSSSTLSTAAKAGIAIGGAFCALLLIAILLLLRRRRKPQQQIYIPPPTSTSTFQPPPLAATPYSGTGPFSPPSMQHPTPLHKGNSTPAFASSKGDISPIVEEKTPTVGITRKDVGGKRDNSSPGPSPPPMRTVQPAPALATPTLHDTVPREAPGSVPPPRHEAPSDAGVAHGHQYVGQHAGYQESRQGQWGYHGVQGAYEVDGGGMGRRELAGGQGGALYGRQDGGTYELGSGR